MKKHLIVPVLIFLLSLSSFGQGCSDAGFCTLQHANVVDGSNTSTLAVGLGYGGAFQEIKILSSYLEYSLSLKNNFSFQTKLTFLDARGDLGNNSGLGDLFVTSNYSLRSGINKHFNFLLGAKIPLNLANDKNSAGFSLPLDYQTSIGTYDLILGANMVYNKKWEFSTALQIPVINKNENEFFSQNFSNSNEFSPTNQFKRKADALFRVGYIYNLKNSRLSFKPNLLAIYHLEKDTYKDVIDNEIAIKGSDGLTVNGGVISMFSFKNNTQLELTTAIPFVIRDVRPDGLTRSYVVNLQYKIKF
jgi:hypothetical protein